MTRKYFFLSLLLALPLMAWAESTPKFEVLLMKALQGDTAAQVELGAKCEMGQEVPQDYTQAAYWYKKAATLGNSRAQNRLGLMYENGLGVIPNYKQAAKWYTKSAKQGNAEAQAKLCLFYMYGKGVTLDYPQAFYWAQKSAEQGLSDGQNNLGMLYEFGRGAKRDDAKAADLYRKAAEQGNPTAQKNLAKMYYWGKGVTKDYAESAKWYQKAAELGDMEAQYEIGKMYHTGKGVTVDYLEAARWYRKAIDQGHQKAGESYSVILKKVGGEQNLLAKRNTTQSTSKPASQPAPQPKSTSVVKTSLVDTNIPATSAKNENTFVIIIANEDYKNVAKVPFALNDGRILAKYCQKTLGIPASHVKLHENATYNDIRLALAWLRNVCDKYEGEASVIFYYTGHGIPDESDRSAYLLPVDGDGRYVATGYKMDDLYQKLGEMQTKSVTVLLDACFSGATRDGKMVAQAKGVALKVKKGVPVGNTVVIAAAQNDETAGFFEEEGHGMFTYFLLKKLQDTQGKVTLQELSQYIIREVGRKSAVTSKPQTPCVTPSVSVGTSWQSWTLK